MREEWRGWRFAWEKSNLTGAGTCQYRVAGPPTSLEYTFPSTRLAGRETRTIVAGVRLMEGRIHAGFGAASCLGMGDVISGLELHAALR